MEIQKEYEIFLQNVLDSQEIYILQNSEGLACQNGEEHKGAMCILIWGQALKAEEQRQGEFESLEVDSISLYEFLFRWLPNMEEEGVFCSINWCEENGGLEIEPDELRTHLKSVLPDELKNAYKVRLEAEVS